MSKVDSPVSETEPKRQAEVQPNTVSNAEDALPKTTEETTAADEDAKSGYQDLMKEFTVAASALETAHQAYMKQVADHEKIHEAARLQHVREDSKAEDARRWSFDIKMKELRGAHEREVEDEARTEAARAAAHRDRIQRLEQLHRRRMMEFEKAEHDREQSHQKRLKELTAMEDELKAKRAVAAAIVTATHDQKMQELRQRMQGLVEALAAEQKLIEHEIADFKRSSDVEISKLHRKLDEEVIKLERAMREDLDKVRLSGEEKIERMVRMQGEEIAKLVRRRSKVEEDKRKLSGL